MVKQCALCQNARAALRRPKTFEQVCKECFYAAFEAEVHATITQHNLFKPGERVAVAASGGKDSTVLAHTLTTLNERHKYGLDLFLLSIDEGISGYRDDSLETVKRNEQQYQIPLTIVSYKDLYGWSMDEIVREIGTKNNCTFCGVFRRQALDRGAVLMKADKIATGHNADDVAETVFLNIVRGDLARLSRCTNIITGEDSSMPRVKPFKYTYEKEIVMYAYFKKLDYFSTECIYSPHAARGVAREFIKDLEATRPRAIVDVIHSAEEMRFNTSSVEGLPQPRFCERCGYISSQPVCKACVLLEGLNRGMPMLGVSRTRGSKTRKAGLHTAVDRTMDTSRQDAQACAGNGYHSSGCGSKDCNSSGSKGGGKQGSDGKGGGSKGCDDGLHKALIEDGDSVGGTSKGCGGVGSDATSCSSSKGSSSFGCNVKRCNSLGEAIYEDGGSGGDTGKVCGDACAAAQSSSGCTGTGCSGVGSLGCNGLQKAIIADGDIVGGTKKGCGDACSGSKPGGGGGGGTGAGSTGCNGLGLVDTKHSDIVGIIQGVTSLSLDGTGSGNRRPDSKGCGNDGESRDPVYDSESDDDSHSRHPLRGSVESGNESCESRDPDGGGSCENCGCVHNGMRDSVSLVLATSNISCTSGQSVGVGLSSGIDLKGDSDGCGGAGGCSGESGCSRS